MYSLGSVKKKHTKEAPVSSGLGNQTFTSWWPRNASGSHKSAFESRMVSVCVCVCVCRNKQHSMRFPGAAALPTHHESLSDIRRLRNAAVVRKRKETKKKKKKKEKKWKER